MIFEEDTDYKDRKELREKAMSELCANLDIMKLTAVHNGDLKQLYFITTNIEKYCSKKYLPEPKN